VPLALAGLTVLALARRRRRAPSVRA
jgi:hypothetical protein